MKYMFLQFSIAYSYSYIHIVEINVVNRIMLLLTDITQTYRLQKYSYDALISILANILTLYKTY